MVQIKNRAYTQMEGRGHPEAALTPGAPVVGTGTGKFTENTQFLSSGTVVLHFTVHGTIDLASGGQARLFATARVVVRPDGTLQFDEERVILTAL